MSNGPQEGLGIFGAKDKAGTASVLARLNVDEHRIATLESGLAQAVTTVSLDGNKLVIGHHDGAKHALLLPSNTVDITALRADLAEADKKLSAQGVAIDALKNQGLAYQHELSDLSSVYSYTGNAPTYPADPKHAYIVTYASLPAGEYQAKLPDVSLLDGTLFYYTNSDDGSRVVLRPPTGFSVGHGDHIDIDPGNFVALVLDGKNFVKIASGLLPLGQSDLTHRIARDLAGQLHTEDQINAMFNKWLANPTTQQKIKAIVASKEPHDTTRVYIGTGQDYPSDFTGAQCPLAPHQKLMAQGMDQTAAKVWIAVPYSVADTVVGIAADGGLPALWDSKRINVQGKYWTVFLSPYPLTAAHVDFTIDWRIK